MLYEIIAFKATVTKMTTMRDFDIISNKYKSTKIIIIIIIIIAVFVIICSTRSYVVGWFAIFWNIQHLPTAIPSIQDSLVVSLLSHFLCRESRSITT